MRITKKTKNEILGILENTYFDAKPELIFHNSFELLIAVILSAQCTDKRVNLVTKKLFELAPDPESIVKLGIEKLEQEIKECGLYRNKAKNIIAVCKILQEKYSCTVPDDFNELLSLPGVGRKTANVIRGNIYGIPSIVVDTHVKRISKKLGLTEEEEPEKVEYALMKVLPEDHWILWNIDIITLGRTICKAGHEKCSECFLKEECPSAKD